MYGQDILCGISQVTFEISHLRILPIHSEERKDFIRRFKNL